MTSTLACAISKIFVFKISKLYDCLVPIPGPSMQISMKIESLVSEIFTKTSRTTYLNHPVIEHFTKGK